MATRERYTVKLACEKCGNTGTATIEEAENPVYRPDPNRVLISAVEGFEWVRGGTWQVSALFRCTTCGTEVEAN